jgi:hypothetical protein
MMMVGWLGVWREEKRLEREVLEVSRDTDLCGRWMVE